MTKSDFKLRDNCSSGVPLTIVGSLAFVFGIAESSPATFGFGVALLLLPVVMYWMVVRTLAGLKVQRDAPPRAFEGDTIEVSIRLENSSRWPAFQPRVSEIFVPEIHAQKEVLFPYRVRAGEKVEASYPGKCLLPRGVYEPGPVAISLSDPFGWFQLRKSVRPAGELKVYPRFDLFGVDERRGEVLSLTNEQLTRFGVGQSTEFFTVREYRSGDPLRRVHWPLTAHRGFPVVREFSRQATGDLYLYLDLMRTGLLGIGRGSSLEYAVRIVAALAAHALRRGHRVQACAVGAVDNHFLPLHGGQLQLNALLDLLVVLKPDGSTPLDQLLEETAEDVPSGATVVLMVNPYLRDSRQFDRQVQAFQRRGVRPLLVVFDDATFHNVYRPPADRESTESAVRRFNRLGAETYVVPCPANLPAIFANSAGGTA